MHTEEGCSKEGNLPAAGKPFPDGTATPADHLRKVFYRMGLGDQDIVALSGAHTLGRARPERSGWGEWRCDENIISYPLNTCARRDLHGKFNVRGKLIQYDL